MKLSFVAVALLVALANARVVPTSDTALEILARDTGLNITYADDTFSDGNEPSTVSTNAEPSKFDKAVEIGRTLDSAMKSKDSVARWFFKSYPNFQDTCQSPFDGDGREELKKWGFDDSDALSDGVKNDCDFDKYHNIKVAFDELGLDTRAKTNGGPNECFKVNHRDGPAIKRKEDGTLPSEANQYYDVCGKEYRATGATFEFAANPSGMLALMNVMSPTYCAEKFTWMRKPNPDELPHIGSTSDIGWAMWNRAATDVKNLKYLVVTQVMNAGSREIFRSALGNLNPPQSEYRLWPGQDFDIDTPGGQAILGSPVGRWAGYLLLQHKEKLGGNRFISKVRLFKPTGASLPYLVFYVNDPPASAGRSLPLSDMGDKGSLHVVKRSTDGKNVIREHVLPLVSSS